MARAKNIDFKLPTEVVWEIFLFADLETLDTLCQINEQGKSICQNDFFWRDKALHDGLLENTYYTSEGIKPKPSF